MCAHFDELCAFSPASVIVNSPFFSSVEEPGEKWGY